MAASVLIIDDEPDIRELLTMTISRMGLDCHSAANLNEATNLLSSYAFDACLTDMRLPDGNGVDFVKHLKETYPDLPVAVVTAHGDMDAAVVAMKNGAYDFVSKPVDIHQLRKLVTTAVALGTQSANDSYVEPDATAQNETSSSKKSENNKGPAITSQALTGTDQLIGSSPSIQHLKEMILKLGRTNAPVWISGESGTGKELTARLIHENSARREGPFIAINCGAIPANLMDSEFFGHKKGSFTGAVSDNQGLFKHAEGGTLFLDEVAELTLPMQVKLLRAIQEKSIRPVGTADEIPIDVRILSASHKNLADEVKAGNFRHDLYYRLNVINLVCPSLRDRKEDVPALAKHMLAAIECPDFDSSDENNSQELGYHFTDEALESLKLYDFPGNVRELENILERTTAIASATLLDSADLQIESISLQNNSELRSGIDTLPNKVIPDNKPTPEIPNTSLNTSNESKNADATKSIDREVLKSALEAHRWNRKATAKSLGLTYRQLRYRIEQLNLGDEQ